MLKMYKYFCIIVLKMDNKAEANELIEIFALYMFTALFAALPLLRLQIVSAPHPSSCTPSLSPCADFKSSLYVPLC